MNVSEKLLNNIRLFALLLRLSFFIVMWIIPDIVGSSKNGVYLQVICIYLQSMEVNIVVVSIVSIVLSRPLMKPHSLHLSIREGA